MLINKDQINLIKNNKVCLVKNFVKLKTKYDFNFISNILENNNLKVEQKSFLGDLKDVFQIKSISKEFKIFFDFFKKIFKYEEDINSNVDIFFNLTSQVGNNHFDIEDVFILGLKGISIYRVYDKEIKDYYINEGDFIFIPKNTEHKVIGITPRIVASFGFFGKRINNGKEI